MWIIRSFRREQVDYVTKWQSRVRCYMGLLCWGISLSDLDTFSIIIRMLGLSGVVPIIVIFLLAIVPMGYTELAIGQFSNCGHIKVWRLSPPFKGLGYTCIYVLSLCSSYTYLVSSVILHYVRGSMKSPVPWFVCTSDWARENCYVFGDKNRYYTKCLERAQNRTDYCDRLNWETSHVHYWTQVIKQLRLDATTKTLENLMYTFFTAVIVFIMLRKGVRSMEVFVPYLCVVPHVLQFVLFSVALMLPGARDALPKFYLPKLHPLKNVTIWNKAMRASLTGTNLGLGGNILFGSESTDFRTPIHMAALGIYFFDFLLSTLFGLFLCTSFSTYAYFAATPLESLGSENGLPFYLRDMSIAFLGWPWVPQIWALMYFLSLYIMVVRTKVLMLHALVSGIYQIFPRLMHYYDLCAFTVVSADLGFSLLYYNNKGITNMQPRIVIYNSYCALIMLCYESIIIMYIYGTANLIDDIHFMLGFRPSAYWKACWYLCPLVLVTFLGLSCQEAIDRFTTLYDTDRLFFSIGIIALMACIIITPAYMLVYLLRYKKTRKWYKLMRPSSKWGPADKRLRKSREMFAAHSMTKEYLYRQQRQSRQFV